MAFQHQAKRDRRYLRQVVFDGYCLRTWQTTRIRADIYLGYELIHPDGRCLFRGAEYIGWKDRCSDSNGSLRDLISLLTHTVDDCLSSEQLAFVEGEASKLWGWAIRDYDKPRKNFAGGPDILGWGSYQFINLDNWEDPNLEYEHADE